VSGWKENSNNLTVNFLKEVNDFGVSRLIYTDINKDGTKSSPNFEETEKIAEISNCPVIISGGVSSIDDVKKAKNLNNKKESFTKDEILTTLKKRPFTESDVKNILDDNSQKLFFELLENGLLKEKIVANSKFFTVFFW